MHTIVKTIVMIMVFGSGICLAAGLDEHPKSDSLQLMYHDVNSEYAQLKTQEFKDEQASVIASDFGEDIVFCLSDGIYVQFSDIMCRRKIIDEGGYSNLVYPVWSQDGSKIAFAAKNYDSRYVDLFVANCDGSDPICILSLYTGYYQSNIQSISWSWNSEYIMFNYAYDDYQNNDYFIVCSIHWTGSDFVFIDDPLRSYSQYEPSDGSSRYSYISTGAFWYPTTALRVSNLDGTNDNAWFTFNGTIAGFTHVCWKSSNSIYTVVRWWDAYPNKEVLVRVERINNQSYYYVLIISDPGASLWCPTASPDRSRIYMAELTNNTSTMWQTTFDNNGNIIDNSPKGVGFFPNWRQNFPQNSIGDDQNNETTLPTNFSMTQN